MPTQAASHAAPNAIVTRRADLKSSRPASDCRCGRGVRFSQEHAALTNERCRRSLDAIFEHAHEILALHSRCDRWQKFEKDAAALLQKAARPGPEKTGIQGHRHAGDIEALVKRGDTRLVVGWR